MTHRFELAQRLAEAKGRQDVPAALRLLHPDMRLETPPFADGLIGGERFCFDLSVLCAQSGVSTDAVRRKLFGETA